MKRILIYGSVFFILLFIGCNKSENYKEEKNTKTVQKFNTVQEKMVLDTFAFRQYQFLGECVCTDRVIQNMSLDLNTSTLYDREFDNLTAKRYLFPTMVIKDSLWFSLDGYIDSQLPSIENDLQAQDENGSFGFTMLHCQKLFGSQNRLPQLEKSFESFVKEPSHFLQNQEVESRYMSNQFWNDQQW